MLTKRVIPCLDVRNGRLTKGIKFVGSGGNRPAVLRGRGR